MYSSLHSSNLSFFTSSSSSSSKTPSLNRINTNRSSSSSNFIIRCGPRNNRGPLVKGRVLSTEAMTAVQALKRARGDEIKINQIISRNITRLIKNDLLASLKELFRQGHCDLGLKIFCAVRSEFKLDCSLYADTVLALSKFDMVKDIDLLISEMKEDELIGSGGDYKGLSKLINCLIQNGRKESVIRVYEMMKEGEWGSDENSVDEYVVEVLSRGLKRLGEKEIADEVERKFGSLSKGNLEKLAV